MSHWSVCHLAEILYDHSHTQEDTVSKLELTVEFCRRYFEFDFRGISPPPIKISLLRVSAENGITLLVVYTSHPYLCGHLAVYISHTGIHDYKTGVWTADCEILSIHKLTSDAFHWREFYVCMNAKSL